MRKVLPRLSTRSIAIPRSSREGGDFNPSALARWISNVTALPEIRAGCRGALRAGRAPPFGDETPAKLLVPRTGAHAVRSLLVIHGTRARHGGQEAARPGSGEGEKTR